MRSAAAAAGIVLAATVACGSRHEPLRVVVAKVVPKAPPCTIAVFLDDAADVPARRAIERAVLDAEGTQAITFVPRSVTLADDVKKHPELGHPTVNDLPDRYEVTFDTQTDAVAAAELVRRLPLVAQTIGPFDGRYLGQP